MSFNFSDFSFPPINFGFSFVINGGVIINSFGVVFLHTDFLEIIF